MDVFIGVPVAFSRAPQAALRHLSYGCSGYGVKLRGGTAIQTQNALSGQCHAVSQMCLHFTGEVFILVIYKNMPPPKSGTRLGHGHWERSADFSSSPCLTGFFHNFYHVFPVMYCALLTPALYSQVSGVCHTFVTPSSLLSLLVPFHALPRLLLYVLIYCPPACVLLPEVHSSSCRNNMWCQQQVPSYLKTLETFNMALSH